MKNITQSKNRTALQLLRLGAFFLTLVGLILPAQAQTGGKGTVVGVVSNAKTGAYIEGAEISVVGTDISTVSQRDGTFTLSNVPAGDHRLNAFYTGYDRSATTDVEVVAGGTVHATVTLNSDVVVLDALKVSGTREGNAASIMRQRTAQNIVNVVSMDAYGDVADGNIGNFLQNLPGVAVNREAGDVVGITVRGMPPELNSLQLDGVRTASAIAGFTPQGDRAGLIDQIPSEFIKEVQVTKANTPDQAADSLGGSVNLITKSAFDFNHRAMNYRLGLYRDVYAKDFNRYGPTGAFSYLDTFGKDRQFGITLSASYSKTPNRRDINQLNAYDYFNYINARARWYVDQNTRTREGLSAKFEFRPDSTLHFGVTASANAYLADNNRINYDIKTLGKDRVADYTRVSRAAIETGATPKDSGGSTAGIAPGYTQFYTEMVNPTVTDQEAREEKRSTQYKIALEGDKTWTDSKLELNAEWNPSRYNNNYWGSTAQLLAGKPVGIAVDETDFNHVKYIQTYGKSIGVGADLNDYTFSRFEQPDLTREEMGDAKADYTKNITVANIPVVLKTGYEFRHQHTYKMTYRPTWLYVGPDGKQGLNTATGVNDDNLYQFLKPASENISAFNNEMPMRDTFSRLLVDQSFFNNPSYWLASGSSVSTRSLPTFVTENVSAYYGQASAKFGRLNVLAGVRLESTDVDANGSYSDTRNTAQTAITVSKNYRKWFPSVHLRYALTERLLLRASYSTSMARPSIKALAPNTSIGYDPISGLGSISQANPGLLPQYSRNYDFSAEYYIEPAGILSVGLFQKNIRDYLYNISYIIPEGQNNGFDGQYADWQFSTTGNLGHASVKGLEVNYSQRFTHLPHPFDGLSGFATYTGIRTNGEYEGGNSALAGFVPSAWNIGLDYNLSKFEARVTYHFKSAYLMTYAASSSDETRVTKDPTTDVNLQYRLNPRASFFFDVVNIFNQTPKWYQTDPSHLLEVGSYGARVSAGISGRF